MMWRSVDGVVLVLCETDRSVLIQLDFLVRFTHLYTYSFKGIHEPSGLINGKMNIGASETTKYVEMLRYRKDDTELKE